MSGGSQKNGRYLSFSLGPEEYAVPLLVVREVIAVPDITPVPRTPSHFLGIMNLRGRVISVIDLRRKLGIKPGATQENAVIICDLEPYCLGIVVDSVNSVITPGEGEIKPKPEIESEAGTEYIAAVYQQDKRLVLLLDIGKALDLADHEAITGAASLKEVA